MTAAVPPTQTMLLTTDYEHHVPFDDVPDLFLRVIVLV
jgi:hypothetical protein